LRRRVADEPSALWGGTKVLMNRAAELAGCANKLRHAVHCTDDKIARPRLHPAYPDSDQSSDVEFCMWSRPGESSDEKHFKKAFLSHMSITIQWLYMQYLIRISDFPTPRGNKQAVQFQF
jgi:hypothetical protein